MLECFSNESLSSIFCILVGCLVIFGIIFFVLLSLYITVQRYYLMYVSNNRKMDFMVKDLMDQITDDFKPVFYTLKEVRVVSYVECGLSDYEFVRISGLLFCVKINKNNPFKPLKIEFIFEDVLGHDYYNDIVLACCNTNGNIDINNISFENCFMIYKDEQWINNTSFNSISMLEFLKEKYDDLINTKIELIKLSKNINSES